MRWRYFWNGAWRPVISMHAAGSGQTVTQPPHIGVVVFMVDAETAAYAEITSPADVVAAEPEASAGDWKVTATGGPGAG